MKKFKKFIIICLVILVIIWLFGDEEEKNIVNSGNKTFTLMVYLCAADLESSGGYATTDIAEMMDGFIDEKVNLIVETGGTTDWQDFDISNDKIQRYQVIDGELKLLDEFDRGYMTDADNLKDFINYSKSNFSADRYGLILWDHGGGTISGYGYDENNPDEDDTMRIDEIKYALDSAGVHFDFIGFDACLMGTFETAYAFKNNADYLIASEETEPGTGWEYESLLDTLSSNTDMDTVELGRVIVDKFVESNNGWFGDDASLSVMNLSTIDGLYDKLTNFASTVREENLENIGQFKVVSKALEKTKAFADGEYDMIDLYNFAENVNNRSSKELQDAINNTVVYNRTTDLMEHTNGISVYIPYTNLDYYRDMKSIYRNINLGGNYVKFLDRFVNIMAGGKTKSKTISKDEESDYSNEEWYDSNINFDFGNIDDYGDLQITESGEDYILKLNDEQWSNIADITIEVFYDDGKKYLDLGSDDIYETDKNGNLLITYDGEWISINGVIVSYYAINTGDKTSKGSVPALVNGEDAELIIVWKKDKAEVVGYKLTDYGNTTMQSKTRDLVKGDTIEFLMDTYSYDWDYLDTITKKKITYDGNLNVKYKNAGKGECYVYYKITDIYNNEYYTEPVIFE